VTDGERERASAAARKPARPKRRQAAEKAGIESSRRSDPERREADEAKKTLGDPGMAAGRPAVRPVLPARDAGTTGREDRMELEEGPKWPEAEPTAVWIWKPSQRWGPADWCRISLGASWV
jgi:hypothetical protein